jgi:hypothetical protein
MHHDRSRLGMVVHTGFEALEPQRVSVAADIRAGRTEQAETRHLAAFDVGESCCETLASAAAVRDELAKQKMRAFEVKDPQPRL